LNGILRAAVAALVLVIAGTTVVSAFVPPGQCALIVASRLTLSEVTQFQRENPNIPRGHVYSAQNGWYAISAGTIETDLAEEYMRRAKQAGQIPQDSYCSSGRAYTGIAIRGDATHAPAQVAVASSSLFDEFDARQLVAGEIQILQSALSLLGHYNGTIDGVWGQRSQAALERYARQIGYDPPTNAHAVMAVLAGAEELTAGDFEAIWFSDFDVSLQIPQRRMRAIQETRTSVVLEDRAHLITVTISSADGRATGTLHQNLQRSHRAAEAPYLLRRDDIWVTSVDDGAASTYLRSHFSQRLRAWTNVSVRFPSGRAVGNVTFIISSIENGRGRNLSIPDTGQLRTLLLEFTAFVAENSPQERPAPPVAVARPPSQQPNPDRPVPHAIASGSSFFINTGGYLITNAHVIEDCREITVDGQPAHVVTSDSVSDLAILRRDDRATPGSFLVFAAESVRLNADITISGFPLADRLGALNVNRGTVSGLQGLRGNPFQLQISAPVQRGNSGGPVVNSFGQVVAVVVSKLDALALAIETGEIPQNVNFAIRAELVQALLSANSIEFTVSSDREMVSAENLADLLQDSTAFVRCRLGG